MGRYSSLRTRQMPSLTRGSLGDDLCLMEGRELRIAKCCWDLRSLEYSLYLVVVTPLPPASKIAS